jgi:hypothetical protein
MFGQLQEEHKSQQYPIFACSRKFRAPHCRRCAVKVTKRSFTQLRRSVTRHLKKPWTCGALNRCALTSVRNPGRHRTTSVNTKARDRFRPISFGNRSPDTMGARDPERGSSASPEHVNKHSVAYRPSTPRTNHSQIAPVHHVQGADSNLPGVSQMSPQPTHALSIPKHRASANLTATPLDQGPRSFEGLDERATELLRGFGGYNEFYGDKDGKQTTQEQMHTILKQAYENVLPYSSGTLVLADALHQNISDAQGLWYKPESNPHDVLDTYIFCETKIVLQWNINRLGGRVPQDDATNVPDKDPSFPLRWAAIKHGVKVRPQRPASFQTALQASSTRVQKRSVSEHMPSANPTAEAGVIRSSSAQLNPAAPDTSLFMPTTGPSIAAMEQKGKKKGPNTEAYDLLAFAPSANVPFPAQGTQANVTAVELIVFFPRYVKSTDIIDRLISNDGTPAQMAHIVNEHRVVRGDSATKGNSFNVWMRTQMRRRGPAYLVWTTTEHQIPPGHDPGNLNIAGLKTEEDVRSTNGGMPKLTDINPGSIQFKDLGDHVKKFPSGLDALDLTRCVKYAMNNPTRSWEYPKDFEDLVAHIGGPALVLEGHHDSAAFRRWKEFARLKSYERNHGSGLDREGFKDAEKVHYGGRLPDVSPQEKEGDDREGESSPKENKKDDRGEQFPGLWSEQKQDVDQRDQLPQISPIQQGELDQEVPLQEVSPIKQEEVEQGVQLPGLLPEQQTRVKQKMSISSLLS